MFQDLSTQHDWPVKKAIVDLPTRLNGNLKPTSIGGPEQMLLAAVRLHLQCKLAYYHTMKNHEHLEYFRNVY